jgi:hypothetical protein
VLKVLQVLKIVKVLQDFKVLRGQQEVKDFRVRKGHYQQDPQVLKEHKEHKDFEEGVLISWEHLDLKVHKVHQATQVRRGKVEDPELKGHREHRVL